MKNCRHLRETLRQKDTVPFLGAGASVGSGLPLGDAAANYMVKSLFRRLGRETEWFRLNPERAKPIGWPRFEVVCGSLSRYVTDTAAAVLGGFCGVGMSETHRILARVLHRPRLWVTTNFDDMIERALDEVGVRYTVIANRRGLTDISELTRRIHVILKLHGDASSVNVVEPTLGLEIEHILREMPESVVRPVIDYCAGRPLLLIGYAARDPDLLPMLLELAQAARSVAWIGFGEAEDAVRRLLGESRSGMFYGGGAVETLRKVTSLDVPPAQREDGKWEGAIDRWLAEASVTRLQLGLAEVLCERGDQASFGTAVSVLTADPIDSEKTIRLLELRTLNELEYGSAHSEGADSLRQRFDELLIDEEDLSKSNRIRVLLTCSQMLSRVGDLGAAGAYAQKAYEESRDLSLHCMAKSRIQYGRVLTFMGSGGAEEAVELLREGVEYARRSGEKRLEASACLSYAIGLMRFDKAPEAEKVLRSVEAVFREVGDPRNIGVWRLNLAECLRIQGKFEQAAHNNERLLELATLIGNRELQWKATGNLGLCYLVQSRIEEAEQAFRDCLAYAGDFKDPEAIGNALYNLGWLRTLLGLWREAIAFFDLAARVYRSGHFDEREGAALSYAGWCHLCCGDREAAFEKVRAIDTCGKSPKGLFAPVHRMLCVGVRKDPADCEAVLSEIDRLMGNDDPEYRLYVLIWLGESLHTLAETQSLAVIAARIVREAGRCPIIPLRMQVRCCLARWGMQNEISTLVEAPRAEPWFPDRLISHVRKATLPDVPHLTGPVETAACSD